MMRYEEGDLADQRPCAGVRADLKMCLLQSDCCKIVSYSFYFEWTSSHYPLERVEC